LVESSPLRLYKVNVDNSSFDDSDNVDFRGILRNDRGNWIHEIFGSCGIASNLLADLSVIWKVLQLA
jgi:hypothetical protein